MKTIAGAVALIVSGCLLVAGCASNPLAPAPTVTSTDSSTQSYGKQAVCAMGSAGVSLIRAGGAGSKALASLIASNVSDPTIVNMANAVVNSTATDTVRNQLADWLDGYCGN